MTENYLMGLIREYEKILRQEKKAEFSDELLFLKFFEAASKQLELFPMLVSLSDEISGEELFGMLVGYGLGQRDSKNHKQLLN